MSHWRGASLVALASVAGLFVAATQANAAIVPTIPLSTSANFSVLAGQTVTNSGNSVLSLDVGVYPGSAITGFPPGVVNAPGTTEIANAIALQAQSDLTTAYVEAAGRPVDGTLTSISNVTLIGGVYEITAKGPLDLTGTLTLDGQNNPDSVFIFQTDSTLTTASGSNIALINGALECNVFWQIGSSATLGSGSLLVGNVMALTTIALADSVTVHGRALARNGEVTLLNDTFTAPTCNRLETPATTTTTIAAATTTAPATTVVAAPVTTVTPATIPPRIPSTGRPVRTNLVVSIVAVTLGAAAIKIARRKPVPTR
jgi:type VI secretion system secreted protein VgrG